MNTMNAEPTINEIANIVKHTGKNVETIMTVYAEGGKDNFDITRAVENKVAELGYDMGSMCAGEPRALAKTGTMNYIAKWRNIPVREYVKMDGFVIGRNGSEAQIVLLK